MLNWILSLLSLINGETQTPPGDPPPSGGGS